MRDNILTCMLVVGCLGVTIGLFRDRAASRESPPPIPLIADSKEPIRFVSAPPFPEQFILSHRLQNLQLRQMPTLEEALVAVADAAHCELQVKWDVLQQVGVQRTTRIQVNEPLAGLSTEAAILRIFAGMTDPAGVDFVVKGHTIIVSTEVDLSGEVVMLVYDIRGLMQTYVQAMQVAGADSPQALRVRAADAITALVMNEVEPDTWTDNGGNVGRCGEFMGFLFVTQTRKNQNAVAERIGALREITRSKLPLPISRPTGGDQ